MKTLTVFAAATLAATITAGGSVAAHDGDDHLILAGDHDMTDEEVDWYVHDRICYAPVDDDPGNLVAVVDSFTRDGYGQPGVGSTSLHVGACFPTAAPAGYWLGSAGIISYDPFPNVEPGLGFEPDPVAVTVTGVRPATIVGPVMVEAPAERVEPRWPDLSRLLEDDIAEGLDNA